MAEQNEEDESQSRVNQTDQDQSMGANQQLDAETAFKKTGGFGRFQVMATIAMALALNSGNYLYYSFAFLIQEQEYLCRYDPGSAY